MVRASRRIGRTCAGRRCSPGRSVVFLAFRGLVGVFRSRELVVLDILVSVSLRASSSDANAEHETISVHADYLQHAV